MQIVLELSENTKQTIRQMADDGKNLAGAVSRGLHQGVIGAATNVSRNFLSGQSLKMRRGNLAKAVTGFMAGEYDGVVGVNPDSPEAGIVSKYQWLLGDETKVIKAKKPGGMLAIPIGKDMGGYALTGAGNLKDEYGGSGSLRDRLPNAFVIKSNGRLLLGIQPTKRSKFKPLFVLVPSVTVMGSGALYDGVSDSLDNITESINNEIEKSDL